MEGSDVFKAFFGANALPKPCNHACIASKLEFSVIWNINIYVHLGVAMQSTYEHCSGITTLKCQNMHENILCVHMHVWVHSRCLSFVQLKYVNISIFMGGIGLV